MILSPHPNQMTSDITQTPLFFHRPRVTHIVITLTSVYFPDNIAHDYRTKPSSRTPAPLPSASSCHPEPPGVPKTRRFCAFWGGSPAVFRTGVRDLLSPTLKSEISDLQFLLPPSAAISTKHHVKALRQLNPIEYALVRFLRVSSLEYALTKSLNLKCPRMCTYKKSPGGRVLIRRSSA